MLLPPSVDHHRHRHARSFFHRNLSSSPHMDSATLRSLALRGGGYSTPRLNDSLHANGAGLVGFLASTTENEEDENAPDMSPLAAYSSLKSLHLSDNGFGTLRGMPRLEELKCLFIERNCLTTLRGLSRAAPSLSTLDASGNRLTEVSVGGDGDCGCLPRTLTTLRLSGNDFSAPGALDGLFAKRGERRDDGGSDDGTLPSLLPHLSTLDLSHCSISDPDTVLTLIESLPSLKALYLRGNPFWDEMRIGRKDGKRTTARPLGARLSVLAAAPRCTYLNDSPVFGDERAAADALRVSGGCAEAAAAAREAFLDAAAAEAERTTWSLERPPRSLMVEEQGEEEQERGVSGDENKDGGDEEGGQGVKGRAEERKTAERQRGLLV